MPQLLVIVSHLILFFIAFLIRRNEDADEHGFNSLKQLVFCLFLLGDSWVEHWSSQSN
ncbi:MAG: hypothetical protein ABI297_01390 [Ginsengibacter sp.]